MPTELRAGHETHFHQFGGGDRPALAIHCTMGSGGMWSPALGELGLNVIAPDLPSHGKSALWDADAHPDFQKLASQIAASFISRPVDLIGHSFGASVALRIAVAAPEAVRSLTLIEPVLFAAVTQGPEIERLRHDQAELDRLLQAGLAEDAARAFMAKWGTGVFWDTIPDSQRERFITQMPVVANVTPANFNDPGNILREGGIEMIDAPVMILQGDQTPEITPLVCAAIAERCQDVASATIPDAGHMLPVTHGKILAELIAMNIERS
jgi:pimeloyl-ACP methyl ester carboxylesterase